MTSDQPDERSATDERAERDLRRAAEAGIHRLSIPTPFMVGRVNAYLIEDSPLTLIDSGPNSAKALDELEQQLRELGHEIEDIELLIVSHQHIDHFGLASILARRSGAEVAALDRLAPFLAGFGRETDLDDAFGSRGDGCLGATVQLFRHEKRSEGDGTRVVITSSLEERKRVAGALSKALCGVSRGVE